MTTQPTPAHEVLALLVADGRVHTVGSLRSDYRAHGVAVVPAILAGIRSGWLVRVQAGGWPAVRLAR